MWPLFVCAGVAGTRVVVWILFSFPLLFFLFARVGHIGPPLHVLSMMKRRTLESLGVAAPLPYRMANAGLCDYKKKAKEILTLIMWIRGCHRLELTSVIHATWSSSNLSSLSS